ncbi:MAG: DUF2269 family protein [Actinomycetota bacterium]
MTLYGTLLFAHVLFAATWIGGAILFHVVARRAQASKDSARIRSLLQEADFLGKRYFGPASMLTLVAGLWLVFEGNWGFDHLFIVGGLAGIALSTAIGFGVIEPLAKKITVAVDASSRIDADVEKALERMHSVSRIDLLILVVVLFLMTVKPGS